jgi:hypothetical protein
VGNLSKNFDRSEFSCSCGCGLDAIDPMVAQLLQKTRDRINSDPVWLDLGRGEFGISVSSGCRCLKHNAEVYVQLHPGKPINISSPHLPHADGLCKAVDSVCTDSLHRYFLVKHGLNFFKNMEWGTNGWVHFDVVDRGTGPCVFFP